MKGPIGKGGDLPNMTVAQLSALNKMVHKEIIQPLFRFSSFLLHPIFIFVVLQIVSISLTVIWVVWYGQQSSIRFVNTYDLTFLITGCILTGIILLGTVVLFVYATKQSLLNKQQRSFVSSVTHELRSPIASMQLSLETLQAHQLDPKIEQQLFSMMGSDLARLVKLVDQILVSARLDRGIKIFERTEYFDIRTSFEHALDNASHLHRDLRSRVEIHCPTGMQVYSAKPAVDLVINNLLENAVKYSKINSPIILGAEEAKDGFLLSVKDRGFGLDKREAKKIFKIFNRGEVAQKKAIPGTGLGLYIVKAVVKVLGGKVWAESPGREMGSTFFVLLPYPDAQEREALLK